MNKRIVIPDYRTVKEAFDNITRSKPDSVGFLEKRPGHNNFVEITYSEFRKDVTNLGSAMIEKLNLKDEKIVIIGENSYEWAVSYIAVLCGAGIAVPMDKELPIRELENLVNRSKAKCIIYSNRKKDIIQELKEKVAGDIKYIEMYSEENQESFILNNSGDKDYTFNEVLKMGEKLDERILMDVPVDEDDFKVLLFTSGTTAESKGVMLRNRGFMENVKAAYSGIRLYDTDRFFSVLPLHHTYEATIGLVVPMCGGVSVAYAQGLKTIGQDLKDTRPTLMLAVPALLENLIKKINGGITKQGKDKLVNVMIKITNILDKVGIRLKRKLFKDIYANLGGSIRILVSAAAPIEPKIGKRIEDFGIIFMQGYGLTETSPLATITPEKDRKFGSVGKETACCKIMIKDPNTEGVGEVLIKGDNVMLGYYENEEATKSAIIDGWFHSGDLGYIDKNRFLFLTGRIKNLIIAQNGKNVYPEELEFVINVIPYIKESMVYEKENKTKENEINIVARITLNEDYISQVHGSNRPSDEELHKIIWEKIKELNKTMPTYKYIKELEIKKEDFIKTTTMKIKRFEEIAKGK